MRKYFDTFDDVIEDGDEDVMIMMIMMITRVMMTMITMRTRVMMITMITRVRVISTSSLIALSLGGGGHTRDSIISS